MKSRLLMAVVAAALLVPGALVAQTTPPPAQTPPPQQTTAPPLSTPATAPTLQFRVACRDDVPRLCGSARGKELRTCLKTNEDKLSPACKTAVAAGRHRRQQAFRAACASDVRSYCTKSARGDLKVRDCLQANETKLSATCKSELASSGKSKKSVQ